VAEEAGTHTAAAAAAAVAAAAAAAEQPIQFYNMHTLVERKASSCRFMTCWHSGRS
jgi:hypothetical protein